MRHYTPAAVVRCETCGGLSTCLHPEPLGRRYACPHHGEGDGDDGPFEATGVGRIGDEFAVSTFYVLDAHPGDVPKVRPPEPPLRAVDEVRFDDYEAVVVRGLEPNEQARERGVAGGTVRANVADARAVLDGEGAVA